MHVTRHDRFATILLVLSGLFLGGAASWLARPIQGCDAAHASFRQATASAQPHASLAALLELEQQCRQAVDLCPSFAEAHNNLADVYEQMGRFSEAIGEYQAAIRANPLFPHPRFGLGDIYFKNGRFADAMTWYREGLRLAPDDVEAYYNRGVARRHEGDMNAAQLDFDMAELLKSQRDTSRKG